MLMIASYGKLQTAVLRDHPDQTSVNKRTTFDHVVQHAGHNVGLESFTIVCHGLSVQKRRGERPQLLLQQ